MQLTKSRTISFFKLGLASSPGQSVTRVDALPLLPEVAHEWPTMLTVMLQASQLKLVVGQDHPTVITFDMALYEKAVQLLTSDLYPAQPGILTCNSLSVDRETADAISHP